MKKLLFLLGTLVTVAFNAAAILLPLGGRTTEYISDNIYPTIITPVGQTFAIWSVIYTGLIYLSIYYLFKPEKIDNTTLGLYLASCVCNSLWIVCWHYLVPVVPVILLFTLMALNVLVASRLQGINKHIYSIYAAWTIIASVINAIVFFKFNLGLGDSLLGIPGEIIAVALLEVGVFIYFISSYKLNSVSLLAVGIWAYIGIFRNPLHTNTIQSAALIFTAVMACLLLPLFYKNRTLVSLT